MRLRVCEFVFGILCVSLARAGEPVILWVSDPLQPDETALLSGEDFTAKPAVELARVPEAEAGEPDPVAKIVSGDWLTPPILQGGEQSLKFAVPAQWKTGIFLCRVRVGGGVSKTWLINAPDVWWVQGDSGETARPGGWLRMFGKCLNFGGKSSVWLKAEGAVGRVLGATSPDGFSLRVALPNDLPPADYTVFAHNGLGGSAGWSQAGTIKIKAVEKWPDTVFDVMDFYGKDKEKEIQKAIRKGTPAPDRTEAVQAALKKAKDNGGGVVFFPAGTYGILSELKMPPRTVLKGEGMGVVNLWWGKGSFALDGGGSQERKEGPQDGYTGKMITGERFGIEDLSLYVPLPCDHAIQAGGDFHMQRVRVRVDRYWMRTPQRQNGTFLRAGANFSITDCDILAKASAIAFTGNGVVARNRVQAGKCNCELAHAANVIVEDNQFVSLDPTAYMNVYEEGRNIYYARNRHESLYVAQSDFSFTFDGPGAGYLGKVAACEGTAVALADDPAYPKWAGEKSSLWKKSAVCILSGRGAGQYRFVTSNQGREWKIDQPFVVAPDESSIITIAPFRGHLLVVGNRFEDASWVNMGYGSSMDVICANNALYRCGQLLNYGLKLPEGQQPSWRVQYLNNELFEGHTQVDTLSTYKVPAPYEGPITRYTIHRGTHLHADNSGSIKIGGNATDIIVEHSKLDHASGTICSDKDVSGVLFRDNEFGGKPARYKGSAALIVPEGK